MKTCSLLQQIREPRILGMAIFDWVATFIGTFLITKLIYFFYKKIKFTNLYIGITLFLLVLAPFIHWYLNIDTMLGYYLGINKMPNIIHCSNSLF